MKAILILVCAVLVTGCGCPMRSKSEFLSGDVVYYAATGRKMVVIYPFGQDGLVRCSYEDNDGVIREEIFSDAELMKTSPEEQARAAALEAEVRSRVDQMMKEYQVEQSAE